MKTIFGKILSFILAFLVLFSTFSFTVEKHICMGEVSDYSFLGNVERCEMPKIAHKKNTTKTTFGKILCCQDIVKTIEGTNKELKVVKELNTQKIQFAVAFVYSYINLFESLAENNIPFKGHSPPLLVKDIQILYETYLI